MENKEKFVRCDCTCSGLLMSVDDLDGRDKHLYMSLYQSVGSEQKLSWRRRFEFLWHVIKTGKPWSDCIVMNKEKALDFAKWINDNINL